MLAASRNEAIDARKIKETLCYTQAEKAVKKTKI
jgi:hypothetical protein